MDILKQYAVSLELRQQPSLVDVGNYIKSQNLQESENFQLDGYDDVGIRTYLLDCMLRGANEADLARIIASLEHFYSWLWTQDLITVNPFEIYNFKGSLPDSNQLQHRHDVFLGSHQEREIARLQALNRLGELTNQISSVQSMLDMALETFLEVMDLDTAWISLKTDSGFLHQDQLSPPEHGFVLASACNLPTGLEQSNRHFLTRPPACHCQKLLNSGRMGHAVNVVECTRLQDAAQSGAYNNGLAFHASVPILIDKRAVGLMNFATKDWQLFSSSDLHFLTAGARMIGLALERAHLYDLNASQRDRMENELKMAQRVQVSLLPDNLPHIPGIELAAFWQPSLEMSGDYYNVFKLPDGCWGIVIADVCGKGAPAALYMAITHSLLRERIIEEVWSPAELLAHVNVMLSQQNPALMFVSAAYAILDPDTFQLTYTVAGHPGPILRRGSGYVEELPGGGSMVLGVDPDAHYVDQKVKLDQKDSILFYTDGITEGQNSEGQFYGLARLSAVLSSGPGSVKGMLTHLAQDLSAWSASNHFGDDVTLFALGRNKPHGKL